MRGYNVISELYHGNLRPCDRSFRNDTDFAITMEAFAQQGDKLRELLTGESAERFDELMSCSSRISSRWKTRKESLKVGSRRRIRSTPSRL